MKNNSYISFSDIRYYYIYDKNESNEMFGPEMIEEFGENLPIDLIERFKTNFEEFKAIQYELRKFGK